MAQPAAAKIEIARAMPCDLPGVRNLQERNHKDNLTPDKLAQGYVSFRTELPLLERIRGENGIVVAKSQSGVVGYELPITLANRREVKGEGDVIIPTFYTLEYEGKKLIDYCVVTGQYCVDEFFRGNGIPAGMHPEFLSLLRGKFELLVFVIGSVNERSLYVAKKKLGMLEIDDGVPRTWKTLVQEIK